MLGLEVSLQALHYFAPYMQAFLHGDMGQMQSLCPCMWLWPLCVVEFHRTSTA